MHDSSPQAEADDAESRALAEERQACYPAITRLSPYLYEHVLRPLHVRRRPPIRVIVLTK